MTVVLTRRHLLTAALAAGAAVPWAGTGPASAASTRLTLPKPTGPDVAGTVALHLIDEARAGRELMISVWYPASRDVRHRSKAAWLADAPLRALLDANGFPADAATSPITVAHENAPASRRIGRQPVILYSHGAGGHRSETTIVAQELVSHGYIVVTVDHTDDAYTQFPDGRLSLPADDRPATPWGQVADMRFVLDRIEELAAGGNPDAERRPLPEGLATALDLRRVGMYGWSKGGTATALMMNTDRRVQAGLSLDGPMESDPPVTRIDRPFMLMTAQFTRAAEPAVARFWSLLHGWRRNVQADGARHGGYCDHQWLIPELATITGMSNKDLTDWIGTLDPATAVRIQQAYPLAFFEQHLRGRRQHLLAGPSPAFPEVRFLP
ncbi:hypothetical protein GCM10010172_34850 [Paractinoplanes ferrugineus]|uniref:Acetylhydrolase n=1 Tax=Paractinoplanes ferrugineus TaxID=113564 RepID=A0A919J8W3_9ACTN|nr:acetylhydrolase [Actinoplanes ferrugineus]GIE15442.1 hypothetical protein Afe05nite_72820 [Actinoplanes ferrugineus]